MKFILSCCSPADLTSEYLQENNIPYNLTDKEIAGEILKRKRGFWRSAWAFGNFSYKEQQHSEAEDILADRALENSKIWILQKLLVSIVAENDDGGKFYRIEYYIARKYKEEYRQKDSWK